MKLDFFSRRRLHKIMLIRPFDIQNCCLCGSTERLTREHKIKNSLLRDQFGDAELFLGCTDEVEQNGRFIQSRGSKHLKFKTKICEPCNTHQTQQADFEFDRFHQSVQIAIHQGLGVESVFQLERYAIGSKPYLNVFRYFAKLLACHLSEGELPGFTRLTDFATGKSDVNCVWLSSGINDLPIFMEELFGSQGFAQHGGLRFMFDFQMGAPASFHSSLTVGEIEYGFYFELVKDEKLELNSHFPETVAWCRERISE